MLKVGMCGAGFGGAFGLLFKAHPLVSEVRLAELDGRKREKLAGELGLKQTYESFDALCGSDVDAIAIFTPPWMHAPQTLQALAAGKHVLCAVPAALGLDDLGRIVREVERTGLRYMSAETSFYYPTFLYCRERYRRGDFGAFVYGQAEYYYNPVRYDFWVREDYGNFPPMLYASHSVAMIVGVTGSRLTGVSCRGFAGLHPKAVGRRERPEFEGNVFSNETALCAVEGGGMCRINEFRNVGVASGPSVRCSIYGTDASFEEHAGGQVWLSAASRERTDLTDHLGMHRSGEDFTGRLSPAHPRDRLPAAFANLPNGHFGSHQFLVDDFVRACAEGTVPPNHVWQAARNAAPGIVAHRSAQLGGAWLEIPDFGWTIPPGAF